MQEKNDFFLALRFAPGFSLYLFFVPQKRMPLQSLTQTLRCALLLENASL
jgi:hypothetical protein